MDRRRFTRPPAALTPAGSVLLAAAAVTMLSALVVSTLILQHPPLPVLQRLTAELALDRLSLTPAGGHWRPPLRPFPAVDGRPTPHLPIPRVEPAALLLPPSTAAAHCPRGPRERETPGRGGNP